MAAEEVLVIVCQNVYFPSNLALKLTCRSIKNALAGHATVATVAYFVTSVQAFEWMRKYGGYRLPGVSVILHQAIKAGNLEVVAWMRELGLPRLASACRWAATEGNLELLQWLASEGFPVDESICARAAKHGHLEILKWAQRNGIGLGDAASYAAAGGQLEVLAWLHANGCTIGIKAVTEALAGHHWGVAKYLYEHGHTWIPLRDEDLEGADPEIKEWLGGLTK